jgi:hypothetical protein
VQAWSAATVPRPTYSWRTFTLPIRHFISVFAKSVFPVIRAVKAANQTKLDFPRLGRAIPNCGEPEQVPREAAIGKSGRGTCF